MMICGGRLMDDRWIFAQTVIDVAGCISLSLGAGSMLERIEYVFDFTTNLGHRLIAGLRVFLETPGDDRLQGGRNVRISFGNLIGLLIDDRAQCLAGRLLVERTFGRQ